MLLPCNVCQLGTEGTKERQSTITKFPYIDNFTFIEEYYQGFLVLSGWGRGRKERAKGEEKNEEMVKRREREG